MRRWGAGGAALLTAAIAVACGSFGTNTADASDGGPTTATTADSGKSEAGMPPDAPPDAAVTCTTVSEAFSAVPTANWTQALDPSADGDHMIAAVNAPFGPPASLAVEFKTHTTGGKQTAVAYLERDFTEATGLVRATLDYDFAFKTVAPNARFGCKLGYQTKATGALAAVGSLLGAGEGSKGPPAMTPPLFAVVEDTGGTSSQHADRADALTTLNAMNDFHHVTVMLTATTGTKYQFDVSVGGTAMGSVLYDYTGQDPLDTVTIACGTFAQGPSTPPDATNDIAVENVRLEMCR